MHLDINAFGHPVFNVHVAFIAKYEVRYPVTSERLWLKKLFGYPNIHDPNKMDDVQRGSDD